MTWTSPIDGFVSVFGGVWLARDLGRANRWAIYLNQRCLSQGDIFAGDPYDRSSPFDFSAGSGGSNVLQNIGVSVGDYIKLQLTRAPSSVYGEFAGVMFKLSAGTEPVGGPGLRLELHPGIRIYGSVGARYRIDYVTGVCPTNWLTLTNIVLPASPHLIIDFEPVSVETSRFYRAIEMP